MRLVMKFGGTSLVTGEKLRKAAEIAANTKRKGNEVIVVVSALADVTDELIEVAKEASNGRIKAVQDAVQNLKTKHTRIVEAAVTQARIRDEVKRQLADLNDAMESMLHDVAKLKELTPRAQDFILSFGEKFSAVIFDGALKDLGVMSKWFTGQEAGIVTDNRFGSAQPLMKLTAFEAQNFLGPELVQNTLPVVAGYIGATPEGVTTTLGRGGSDYTATILGMALKTDEVWIWTDVNGLMTADPKIEPLAQTISTISYDEAVEMAYFGARGMHPRALEPVAEARIPVRVRNTFQPTAPGSLIVGERYVNHEVAKAVAIIRDVSLINVSGAGMAGVPGMAASVFSLLGQNDVNILMISQSSSEANISFVVPQQSLLTAMNVLEINLLGKGTVRSIFSEDDVCIIAIVGAGMKGSPGVAARVFKVVSDQWVNVRMIAQGSSELNISFLVKNEDGERVIRALHREFNMDRSIQME